jgi:nucleoid-associated protein YgaU
MTTLASGSSLAAGQSITSANGKYKLELQADGNLVLSGAGGKVWDTDTAGKDGSRVDMQADGNFVLYTAAGGVVWRTDTADKPGAHLVLQDDRNVVIYAADGGTVLWSPNTYLTDAEKAAEAQQEAAAQEAAAKAKADADAAAAAADAAPPAAPAAPAHQTYTVVRGDTLSAIAKRFYGKASDYKKIASANNIANPDLIHPGQNLIIP